MNGATKRASRVAGFRRTLRNDCTQDFAKARRTDLNTDKGHLYRYYRATNYGPRTVGTQFVPYLDDLDKMIITTLRPRNILARTWRLALPSRSL